MKITTMIKTAVAVVSMTTIAVAGAPITSAADYPVSGKLGSEMTMTDTVGLVVLGWKVSDLKSSTDVISDYPVAGDLWEATATVNAISGPVTPAISQFNARTADGVNIAYQQVDQSEHTLTTRLITDAGEIVLADFTGRNHSSYRPAKDYVTARHPLVKLMEGVNPQRKWLKIETDHKKRVQHLAPDVAQTKYLVAKADTDLDGHAGIAHRHATLGGALLRPPRHRRGG